jgi:hypothetical protein
MWLVTPFHAALQVVLRSIQDSKLEAAEVQVLLQDETEAASWVQEAIRLFGPSEHIPPLGSAGESTGHALSTPLGLKS